MKKVIVSNKRKSREYLANPYMDCNMLDRIKKSNGITYNGKIQIIYLGNGYAQILAGEIK